MNLLITTLLSYSQLHLSSPTWMTNIGKGVTTSLDYTTLPRISHSIESILPSNQHLLMIWEVSFHKERMNEKAMWQNHQNHLLSFNLIMHIINSISLLLITRISLCNTFPRFYHHLVRFVFRCLLTVTVNADDMNQYKSTMLWILGLIIPSSTNSMGSFAFFHRLVIDYLSLRNDSSTLNNNQYSQL